MGDDEKLTVLQRVRKYTGRRVIDPDAAPGGFGHAVPNLENAAKLLDEPGKVNRPREYRLRFEDVFLVVILGLIVITVAVGLGMLIL